MDRRRGDLLEGGPDGLSRVAEAMTSASPSAVEDALGTLTPEEWGALTDLIGTQATRSVQRSREQSAGTPKRGHVVLLPGIMGTDLAVVDVGGVPSLVWFSVKAMALGGLKKLALPVDGSPPEHDVHAGGLMKLFYLPMQVRLGVHWNTQLFPYDWRLDIWNLADRLAERVRTLVGQPVHLVAHSLGGLVSRAMIHRHPDVWAQMRQDGDNPEGGRLVMLGTPNRGSFAPVLAFTGQDRKVRGLALLDTRLRKDDVVRVVATFPGLYQMLPSRHAGLSPAVKDLYSVEGWPNRVVHQPLLDRAAAFQDEIEGVVDAPRMVYVAGYGHKTVDDVDNQRGKLRWHRSQAGDGTVPHALGLLPGVRTFWSTSSHGSLPKDPLLLGAIDDLLLTGQTARLDSGDTPPLRGDDGDWVDDEELAAEMDAQAGATRAEGEALDLLADVVPVTADAVDVPQVPVRIEVVWGDIAKADADVVAVGHYQNVYPTAAEAALDRSISGDVDQEERFLHAATARGVLTGVLGEVSLFPRRPSGPSGLAAVVGMGRPGRFGLRQHEVVVRNLIWTSERAGAKTLAMVLIGSGSDNLGVAETAEHLLRAIDVAVREQELTGSLATIRIVERELGRAQRVHATLRRCLSGRGSDAPAIVELGPRDETEGGVVNGETALQLLLPSVVSRRSLPKTMTDGLSDQVRKAVQAQLELLDPEELDRFEVQAVRGPVSSEVPTRLSILVRDGEISVSAISDTATVAERPLGLELDVFEALVARANEEAGGDLERAGEMLLEVAVPDDFRQLLHTARRVVIEVDKHTAALPWEILGAGGPGPSGNRALGLQTPLARQLRTAQAGPPVVTGRLVLQRALVIGDPGRSTASGLPGASREALAVDTMLRRYGVQVDLLLGAGGDPAHAEPATLANVLHHLIHRTYDLVHYAGHGTFSVADAAGESGWVLADRLFKDRHLMRARRLPPLVVANACHSGRVSTGLPGLADGFMSRGVRNLVGTARAVTDGGAEAFCNIFYQVLLTGVDGTEETSPTLGRAILAGRQRLCDDRHPDWDAYQLYGDPDFRFWDAARSVPGEQVGG